MGDDEVELSILDSLSLGRHSSLVEDSICTSPVTKEVCIGHDDVDATLYVRVVCDGCGTIKTGIHEPHRTVSEL